MPQPNSAAMTILQSTWRFTVVSLVVFGLWALAGRWFYDNLGEAGFYLVCALSFIGLSGLLLHPLTAGRLSLPHFYGAFTLAFMTYAVTWSIFWFAFRNKTGEWLGSTVAPAILAVLLLRQTKSHPASIPLLLGVMALHSLGYFAGDSLYFWAKTPGAAEFFSSLGKKEIYKVSQMLWGLCYGLGLGSALGLILHQIATQAKSKTSP